MKDETDWKNLIGERVLVKLSPYQIGELDVTVTSVEEYNGKEYVYFNDDMFGYFTEALTLMRVHKSNKFQYGYIWD